MNKPDPYTIAIIQARMNSSRLPGKVMLDLQGRPMLGWVVERTRRAHLVQQVVVATTNDASDDAIDKYCKQHHIDVFRGSSYDVLDRFYQAAKKYHAELVVRITADCPFIDAAEIDHVITALIQSGADFAANRLPPPAHRTYPIGLDIEACPMDMLEKAWKEADQPHQREHVMPFMYEDENRFRVKLLHHQPDYGNIRITVDTAEDLELARLICANFPGQDDFPWQNIVELLQTHPEFSCINAGVHHKSGKDIDSRMLDQA